jgi:hypothetical protein
MAKKEVTFFYAGRVLNDNRQSIVFFDGIWIDKNESTFNQIRKRIKRLQSRRNDGAKVALTALTILAE